MVKWSEELTLLKYEMEWTSRYFVHCSDEWVGRANDPDTDTGPKAYAARQSAQWMQMTSEAKRVFSAVNRDYVKIVM
jgi:hypothetical protein